MNTSTPTRPQTKFVESQPKIWQEVYTAYKTIHDKESLKCKIESILQAHDFPESQAKVVAPQIIDLIERNFNPSVVVLPTPTDTQSQQKPSPSLEENTAYLTKKDIEWMKAHLSQEQNIKVILYIVALAVYARIHPHRSNWIRYEKKEMSFLAGIHKYAVKDQEVITQIIHDRYNLNMQVTGSMQPIPCFQFSWQADPSNTPDETTNPLVIIADYTPQALLEFVMSTIIVPSTQTKGE